MKAERILYCIFGLFLFAACSGGEDYEQQLEWFEEMNRTDVPLCVDSVQPLVRHYDHWWHSRNHRMRAYYMLGCAYRDQGSAPRALENYQRAVNVADTTDARCDLNVLMRIHSQMSQIFHLQRLAKQEEQELQTAEHLAWQIGDTLSALIFEEKSAFFLYNNKEYKKCLKKALIIGGKYEQYGYKDEALLINNLCIYSCLSLKDYNNAKTYLDLYESCSYFKDSSQKIDGGMGALYVLKGQYYIGVELLDSAEYYFHKAIPYHHDLHTYKGLYQTYKAKHDIDSVLKYTQLYSEAKERNYDNSRTDAIIQTNKLYDYSIEQQKAREQAERASRLTRLLVIATALIVAMILLLLYYRRNKKRRFTELIKRYQAAVQELYEAEEDLNEENQKHAGDKNLIAAHEKKITELSAQVDTLIQTIRKIESEAEDYDLEKSKIVTSIMALRMQGKSIRPEEWDALSKAVEERYPTFHEHMNSRQQLNETEYRVCLLLVSGFNPTDIEILMGKSNSFAAMTRKRLCIKVFGIEGKPQDFDRLLRQSYNNESSC